MDNFQETIDYFKNISLKLTKLAGIQLLGEEMQKGTRLSKTDRGARTNARIEQAQKNEGFDETGITEDELNDVGDDITDELFNRSIEDVFKE